MKSLIPIIFLLGLLSAQVFEERNSFLFLVDDAAKACTVFWPGDDYEYYELDGEWRHYEDGKFARDFYNTTYWCEKIGYTYIGETEGTPNHRFWNPGMQKTVIGLVAAVAIYGVLKTWNKL